MRWNIVVFIVVSLVVAGLGSNVTGEVKPRTWSNMSPAQSPGVKICEGMAYDSESDRTIMFGGYNGKKMCAETWAYDYNTNTWENRTTASSPPGRCGAALVYDAKRDACYMFGGLNDTAKSYGDMWKYDYNANKWTLITPAVSPSSRGKGYLAYDSQSDELVYFGGINSNKILNAETWTYSFTDNTWTNRTSGTHPQARWRCHMTYDSESDRIIMFGGWLKDDSVLDDTWAYDCNTHKWTQMNPSVKPMARARNGLTYIPEWDLIFLTHGYKGGKNDTDDSWTYDYNTNTWKQVTLGSADKPPARHCFNLSPTVYKPPMGQETYRRLAY
jgi:hypothetical protein